MKYYDDLAAVSYATRKGREESKAVMIVNMFANGIDVETIALCASMPVKTVREILNLDPISRS